MKKGCLQPTELEEKAMELILEGDHPILEVLRSQLDSTLILSRKMTGVGFYTEYKVFDQSTKLDLNVYKARFPIGAIGAEIGEKKELVGFNLWIIDGFINFLEGFVYDGCWPDDESIHRVFYFTEDSQDTKIIFPLKEND